MGVKQRTPPLKDQQLLLPAFLCLVIAMLMAAFAWLTPVLAAQSIPYKMNFQGRLTNSGGTPMADGQYNMRFRIYDAPTGGTQLWTETRETTSRVTVTNGLFSVQLGDVTALDPAIFNSSSARYFEIELPTTATATCNTASCATFNGTEILTPRNPLGASAYAMNADLIDGIDGSSLARNDAANTFTSANTFNSTVLIGGANSATKFVINDNTPTALLTADTQNTIVKIGTTASATLANARLLSTDAEFAGTVRIGSASDGVDVSATGISVSGAGATVRIVGGATGTRPSSPTEGMIYYDQTTKEMLTYNGTSWVPMKADGKTATVIVGTSASGGTSGAVASKSTAGADFINTSDTSAQTVINQAIAALPATGGSIYLMEGTYIIDGSISLPNNTTLAGAGPGTVIKLKNGHNTDIYMVTNSDTSTGTRVVIDNLRIDGNRSNQSGAVMMSGIYMDNMGNGSTATSRDGAKISRVIVQGIYQNTGTTAGAIHLNQSSNSTITNSTVKDSTTYNINVFTGFNNIVTNNIVQGGGRGIDTNSSTNSIYANNILQENTTYGMRIANGINNTISDNKVNNSGNATSNNAIFLSNTDISTITGNDFTDTSCSNDCYAINISNSTSDNNYLADNRHSGTTTNPSTIQDLGTGTVYANQPDGSGNLINRGQAGFSVGRTTAGTSLDLQGALRSSALPTPAAPTLTVSGTTGSTTYRYQVTALDGLGETLASTIAEVTNGNATLSATNRVNVALAPVGGAVQYRIYRCTGSGCTPALLATVASNIGTYQDTANGSPSGALPTANTTGGMSIAGTLQGGSSLTLGTSSTTNGSLVVRNATNSNTVSLISGATTASYSMTLPISGASGAQCLQSTSGSTTTATVLLFGSCGGGGGGGGGLTRKVQLIPEYAGGVLRADGSDNSGSITSDFDAVNNRSYYSWSSSVGTLNDYEVVVRSALPSEYASGFGTFRIWAYANSTSNTNNNIEVTIRDASGTACASNVSVLPGTANVWAQQSVSISGCTFAADDLLTFTFRLSSRSNNAVRIGELSYSYTN